MYTKPYNSSLNTYTKPYHTQNQTRTMFTSPSVIKRDIMALFVGIDYVGNLKKVGEVFVSINNTSVDVKLHTYYHNLTKLV